MVLLARVSCFTAFIVVRVEGKHTFCPSGTADDSAQLKLSRRMI
jgi:hypothetical protein